MPPIAERIDGHGRLALPEQQHVHGHLAERDLAAHRADGDPCVRRIERAGADETEEEAPRVAPDRERAILAKHLLENLPVAVEQPRPELEQLHFLGVSLRAR